MSAKPGGKGKGGAKGGKGAAGAGAPFKPLPPPEVGGLVSSAPLPSKKSYGKFYVTTAINYTNGPPHIGHAYEALLTDTLARYGRLQGKRTFFLTGTDEHGQKIAQTAEALGVTPKQLCDKYVAMFQALNKRMLISNDDYIRTTDQHHEDQCRELWRRCAAAGDIYLGEYEGWYNTREECFVPEAEAKENDYKDPATGKPLSKMREVSYFFRLGKYQKWLKDHITAHPEFIQPEERRRDILEWLAEELRDLCVSRTTFDWGVAVPEGFDKQHVMYVWFDALTNYVSGTYLLQDPKHERADLWPAECHVIGKDITRFHCVYWPCMLHSAGLPLPKSVFGHGFVNDKDGKKMSKSFGNVIDPNALLDKYPSDSFRFYMCHETPCGGDMKFNEAGLVEMHNNSLADTYGNLALRALVLTGKFCGGKVPAVPEDRCGVPLPFDFNAVRKAMDAGFDIFDVKAACQAAMEAARETNKWITVLEPWKMKEAAQEAKRTACLRLLLEAVYVISHLLAPFAPVATTACLKKLGTPPRVIPELSANFDLLVPGTEVSQGAWEGCGETPFPKLPMPEEVPAAPAAAAAAAPRGVVSDPPLPPVPKVPRGNPGAVDAADAAFRFSASLTTRC